MRKSSFDARSATEITEEDLENIAYRSKDKVWDKEKVQSGRRPSGLSVGIPQPLDGCSYSACALSL